MWDIITIHQTHWCSSFLSVQGLIIEILQHFKTIVSCFNTKFVIIFISCSVLKKNDFTLIVRCCKHWYYFDIFDISFGGKKNEQLITVDDIQLGYIKTYTQNKHIEWIHLREIFVLVKCINFASLSFLS